MALSRAILVLWLVIDRFRRRGNGATLLVDRFGELLRPADIDRLAGGLQPFGDAAVRGHSTEVGGDLFLEFVRHALQPEQADQPFHLQRWEALLARRWHIGGRRDAALVVDD